jgi:hypothetical protein
MLGCSTAGNPTYTATQLLLEVAEVVDRAGVAVVVLHDCRVEAVARDIVREESTHGVEGVERRVRRLRPRVCPGETRPLVCPAVRGEHGVQRQIASERIAVKAGVHGGVEQVGPAVAGQLPRAVLRMPPEAGRAPSALCKRPTAMADDELRVLGLTVVGGLHLAGKRAGVVPAADVLERPIPRLGHFDRFPCVRWPRDIRFAGSARSQDPEQVRTVGVSTVLDAAAFGPQVPASEPVCDEALAGIDDAVAITPRRRPQRQEAHREGDREQPFTL